MLQLFLPREKARFWQYYAWSLTIIFISFLGSIAIGMPIESVFGFVFVSFVIIYPTVQLYEHYKQKREDKVSRNVFFEVCNEMLLDNEDEFKRKCKTKNDYDILSDYLKLRKSEIFKRLELNRIVIIKSRFYPQHFDIAAFKFLEVTLRK